MEPQRSRFHHLNTISKENERLTSPKSTSLLTLTVPVSTYTTEKSNPHKESVATNQKQMVISATPTEEDFFLLHTSAHRHTHTSTSTHTQSNRVCLSLSQSSEGLPQPQTKRVPVFICCTQAHTHIRAQTHTYTHTHAHARTLTFCPLHEDLEASEDGVGGEGGVVEGEAAAARGGVHEPRRRRHGEAGRPQLRQQPRRALRRHRAH